MPNVSIQDGNDFPGLFSLASKDGKDLTGPEANYRDILERVMDAFKTEIAEDPLGDDPKATALRTRRLEQRGAVLDQLRSEAEEYAAGINSAQYVSDRALLIRGKHISELQKLDGMLFRVDEVKNKEGFVTGVEVTVSSGLPAPDDTPTAGQQELYATMMGTLTVIQAVYQGIIERNSDHGDAGAFRRWFGLLNEAGKEARRKTACQRLDHYVREVAGVGRVGLQSGFLDLGKLALSTLRQDLVAMEAARIKNSYAKRLGLWAVGALAVALAAYFGLRGLGENRAMPFIVATAGAAIGTWLSFSIRRVTLSFEQLAAVEEDLLLPPLRILFVIGLTLVVMLVFYTGALNVVIGDLDTSLFGDVATPAPAGTPEPETPPPATFGRVATISLLVGLFCGIAERALASAVSTRATDFVGTFGGSPRT